MFGSAPNFRVYEEMTSTLSLLTFESKYVDLRLDRKDVTEKPIFLKRFTNFFALKCHNLTTVAN